VDGILSDTVRQAVKDFLVTDEAKVLIAEIVSTLPRKSRKVKAPKEQKAEAPTSSKPNVEEPEKPEPPRSRAHPLGE
jgi:hypothetical protein